MLTIGQRIEKTSSPAVVVFAVLIIYALIGLTAFSKYFIWDSSIAMGLMVIPFAIDIKKGVYSNRFFAVAFFFLILLYLVPATSVLFLTMLFSVLFLIESSIGRLNNTLLFLLLLLSPVFNYFKNMLGFPIRLWLSEVIGLIFSQFEKNVVVAGNIICINGFDFSVDTACAGLNMLLTSLLICIFLIATHQKRMTKQVSIFVIVCMMVMTVLLNIVCNLMRIITLILFKIGSESIFHDLIGIVCLLIYVAAPLLFLTRKIVVQGQTEENVQNPVVVSRWVLFFNTFLLLFVAYGSGNVLTESQRFMNSKKYVLNGYSRTVLENGVQKFENKTSLVYIKPMCYYSAEHNPMICWRGSGYDFKVIQKEKVKNVEIYTAVLKKGKDILYTAWWFDSESEKTIDQLKWRWTALNERKDFVLVNVSATSKEGLLGQIRQFFETPLTFN